MLEAYSAVAEPDWLEPLLVNTGPISEYMLEAFAEPGWLEPLPVNTGASDPISEYMLEAFLALAEPDWIEPVPLNTGGVDTTLTPSRSTCWKPL